MSNKTVLFRGLSYKSQFSLSYYKTQIKTEKREEKPSTQKVNFITFIKKKLKVCLTVSAHTLKSARQKINLILISKIGIFKNSTYLNTKNLIPDYGVCEFVQILQVSPQNSDPCYVSHIHNPFSN